MRLLESPVCAGRGGILSASDEAREILKGIDQTEVASEDGWWETSTGSRFGKEKLEQILALIERLTTPAE
jgi:hypothetical protein